ncbi:MAG: ring-opening amidohydrolase [bacterium]|nr:ring-opening amidohydrolase [Rhodocyclaceae bacterium]MCE2979877.1 ring-opening amidohydrolase [Betaproteobacteria bacterium]
MTAHVIAYDTANPGDVSDFSRNLARFEPARIRKLALLVKTEGNSDVNDFSREFALLSLTAAIEAHGGTALAARSTFLISTGCEGAMTPFGYLFVDLEDDAAVSSAKVGQGSALAFGCARSRSLTPEEIGTPAHAAIVAETVAAAMRDADVGAADVALVIVKTPVTSHIPATAGAVRNTRVTSAHSKAVGALGAGLALGEVPREKIVQEAFNTDHSLYAKRAMVFSGAELDCVEILLLANRPGAAGDLSVHTGFLRDVLDAKGLREMYTAAGCGFDADGQVADAGRVVATLIKAGSAPDGKVRGVRTTMKSSHLDMDKHVRAAMSGIIGSILGSTRTFISANTVHQAPPGGGLCACIVRKAS